VFEALIGEWHGEGAVPTEPPMKISAEAKLERLGEFIVMTSALEGSTWKIWRAPGEDWNGPDGPGLNQRFIGEISADGKTIESRWERGMGTPAMSGRPTTRSTTSASSL
jgi:hypothetical protein